MGRSEGNLNKQSSFLATRKKLRLPFNLRSRMANQLFQMKKQKCPSLKSDAPIEASAPQEPIERRPELAETPQPTEAPTFFSLDESASDAPRNNGGAVRTLEKTRQQKLPRFPEQMAMSLP